MWKYIIYYTIVTLSFSHPHEEIPNQNKAKERYFVERDNAISFAGWINKSKYDLDRRMERHNDLPKKDCFPYWYMKIRNIKLDSVWIKKTDSVKVILPPIEY